MITPHSRSFEIKDTSPEEIWWKAYDQDKKRAFAFGGDSYLANMIALYRLNTALHRPDSIDPIILDESEEYRFSLVFEILNPNKIKRNQTGPASLHYWLRNRPDLKLPDNYFSFQNRSANNGFRDHFSIFDDLVIDYCNNNLIPTLSKQTNDPLINCDMIGLNGATFGLRIASRASNVLDHTLRKQKPPKCFYYSVPFWILKKEFCKLIFKRVTSCSIQNHHQKDETNPIKIVDQNSYFFDRSFFDQVYETAKFYSYPFHLPNQ
ncbi:MAG: hypothetical protein ACRCXZ_07445 [Patescibacteria group bacterium]